MNRTILNLMLLAAVATTPACLGDQPTPEWGTPGLRPINKPPIATTTDVVPASLHLELLQSIETHSAGTLEVEAAARRHAPASWSETIQTPEICGECTVTVIHLFAPGTASIELLDVDGEALCSISARQLASGAFDILTDSCGERAE